MISAILYFACCILALACYITNMVLAFTDVEKQYGLIAWAFWFTGTLLYIFSLMLARRLKENERQPTAA